MVTSHLTQSEYKEKFRIEENDLTGIMYNSPFGTLTARNFRGVVGC